jgi:hypothetical protein
MTTGNERLELSRGHVDDKSNVTGFGIHSPLNSLSLMRSRLSGMSGLSVQALLKLAQRANGDLLGGGRWNGLARRLRRRTAGGVTN